MYEKTHPELRKIIKNDPREPLILSSAISATYIGVLMMTPLQPTPMTTLAANSTQALVASNFMIQLMMKGNATMIAVYLRPSRSEEMPQKSVPQTAPRKLTEPSHDMKRSDMGSVPTGGWSDARRGCMGEVHPSIVPIENAERLAETDTVLSQESWLGWLFWQRKWDNLALRKGISHRKINSKQKHPKNHRKIR